MNPEEIRALLLKKQAGNKPNVAVEVPQVSINIPAGALPKLENEEFLADFMFKENRIVVCFKELYWHEVLDIDNECLLEHKDKTYYNEEHMIRLTLNKAIRWIMEFPSGTSMSNTGSILSEINNELGNVIWQKYLAATAVTTEQAAELMAKSSSYFTNQGQEDALIPHIVILVDMIAQGVVTYSEAEFMKMPNSKLEKIKLILAARMTALHSTPSQEPEGDRSDQLSQQESIKRFMVEMQNRRGG